MYDIFISYRRDGGHEMARLLYEHLEAQGYRTFFDLEELKSGRFNTKLYENIETAQNFVLVLPRGSLDRCVAEDDWLRLEIEHAIKLKRNIIPVMMRGFCWPENLPDCIKDLPNYNGVQMSNEYFDASVSRIIHMMVGVSARRKEEPKNERKETERIENKYFTFEDEKEKRRLKVQQNLMKDFDASTYRKVAEAYDELYILDIGSNNGDFVMDRIGKSEKVKFLVGLEYDGESVAVANQKYGEANRILFYEKNVEEDDLQDMLQDILDAHGVRAFNVINVSMVLLHMKNPYRLLKQVRKLLAKGGSIVIKDIDDGFNIAYPDENGDFARVVDICGKLPTAGYRLSGRQVYTLLKRAGYTDVRLEKMGLSTIGMDYEERCALFDTYFSFILEDLKIMRGRHPDDRQFQTDYEWYRDIYEDLEERFQDESFFFTLGFVMYTAQKR